MNSAALGELLKKYLIASIFVGTSILLIAAIVFRSGEVPEREKILEQKSADGRRLQSNITNSALLHEHVNSLSEVNKAVVEQLVNPNQLAENLQYFYRIEAASGAKLVDVRQVYSAASAKGSKGAFVPIPYTISIQGGFRTVLNFVRRIEKSNRISRIMTASLGQASGGGEHEGQEVVSMNLNVELLGIP